MIEIDEDEFPLIKVTIRGQMSLDDWAELTAVTAAQFEDKRRFSMAVRTVDFKLPELRLLKEMGAWVGEAGDDIRDYLVRSGLCIPSAMARGALNFINRVGATPIEQGVFADWDEAVAWAREGLDAPQQSSRG